jgi:glutamyl-tRNA synthetase
VAAAASAPHAEHEGPVYPGTCVWRTVADAAKLEAERKPFAWRFRVADSPAFTDGFAGEVRIDLKQMGGDFVVWKSAGMPAYQLAVVADDIDMGITEVVRGDDLLPSTPRQLLIYRALGKPPPRFVQVPLVVGPDGRRLAKRHGDTRLATLRSNGVAPERLIGVLAWSCGWAAEGEKIAARELLSRYRLDTIPKGPFVWRDELLA